MHEFYVYAEVAAGILTVVHVTHEVTYYLIVRFHDHKRRKRIARRYHRGRVSS